MTYQPYLYEYRPDRDMITREDLIDYNILPQDVMYYPPGPRELTREDFHWVTEFCIEHPKASFAETLNQIRAMHEKEQAKPWDRYVEEVRALRRALRYSKKRFNLLKKP